MVQPSAFTGLCHRSEKSFWLCFAEVNIQKRLLRATTVLSLCHTEDCVDAFDISLSSALPQRKIKTGICDYRDSCTIDSCGTGAGNPVTLPPAGWLIHSSHQSDCRISFGSCCDGAIFAFIKIII